MYCYRVAVCEDDSALREELRSLCHDILEEDGIGHEITVFSSAQELDRVLKEKGQPFDLLILDIQMEGMTGMELAKTLRQPNPVGPFVSLGGFQKAVFPFSQFTCIGIFALDIFSVNDINKARKTWYNN